jgi:ATP-dependent helicase/nuclease subunit B
LKDKSLPDPAFEALRLGATIVCASAQRQAAVRAAWARAQRDKGRRLWPTPAVFTFPQFVERQLDESWASSQQPDRLLPAAAEWAALREWRREVGAGTAEARALLQSARRLDDWRIPRTPLALGGSLEGDLLLGALQRLDALQASRGRRPLRAWLDEIEISGRSLLACGTSNLAAAPRAALRRWGALEVEPRSAPGPITVQAAENDDHELELIAGWCRDNLERDPGCRLLIVDARLRQRRAQYDRVLSQSLSPSYWLDKQPRAQSPVYAIEGGRPLPEFPLVAHALLTLRLLTTRLRFDELVHWLRLPFLDGADGFAGAAVEASLRLGRRLEFSGDELATFLERTPNHAAAVALAQRLRQAAEKLGTGRHGATEWSPRLLAALRVLGWPGSRPLRSDEQQTVARVHLLLDEFAALGGWLSRLDAADAVAMLGDLASDRYFDPESVAAPVTLTESHDDPVVHHDAIWVAGLDAAQWPAPPRPDVFIPLRLQVQAGVPWASAAGQTRAAHRSMGAWRAAAGSLVCSWARSEGDAHRSISPLLERMERHDGSMPRPVALASRLRRDILEEVTDEQGLPVDTSKPVAGGVTPLTLQSECGFHAYAQVRLAADELDEPAPGIDARDRGMLLHKALELVWIKLKDSFHLAGSTPLERSPLITTAIEAAVVAVFRGYVPHEIRLAVEREKYRLERLISDLLELETQRAPFSVEACERAREVSIAGGRFHLRIDRIDAIEGGGYAILDYKSGRSRAPRWNGEQVRDPQLLAYLLSEAGRNVQALANVSLAGGRARFAGKASRPRLLPDVKGVGLDPNKIPAEQIDAAWQAELERWLLGLARVATDYIAGHAPVQPAADVCRNCHLTILCRRVELQSAELEAPEEDEAIDE